MIGKVIGYERSIWNRGDEGVEVSNYICELPHTRVNSDGVNAEKIFSFNNSFKIGENVKVFRNKKTKKLFIVSEDK